MFVLGITGGVGAGKSVVLSHLKDEYKAYIVEADALAKSLMEPGGEIFASVVNEFGEEILLDGGIDRQKLAALVFSDPDALERLNGIVHPGVKDHILRDIAREREAGDHERYVIEAALLIQDGYDKICDEIWYIRADEKTRVKRITESRGYSEKRCTDMIKSQPEDAWFEAHTDRVITNNDDFSHTAAQIKECLNLIQKSDKINQIEFNSEVRE